MRIVAIMQSKGQWMKILLFVSLLGLVGTPTAWAQLSPGTLSAIGKQFTAMKSIYAKLSAQQKAMLSGSALNMIHLAEQWDDIVTDGDSDVLFSRFGGFTQSETSTAWCGHNVVIGFNDSGSFLESLFSSPSGSTSFTGYVLSTDKGQSFIDRGFLSSDPVPAGTVFYNLGGDPVVKCTDSRTFYYASLGTNFIGLPEEDVRSEISVSKSTDGGESFSGPLPAASKDAFLHFLDKPWMAVDSATAQKRDEASANVYVTYTDFDFSGFSAVCGDQSRTAIEFVKSTDGGATWSPPIVLEEVCGDDVAVQGSQVEVGPHSEIYVAWEAFTVDRQINIRKSTDFGTSFGPTMKVADVAPVGSDNLLQGFFRSAFEFPSLAVDQSGGATNGYVYVTWHDGRNLFVPDVISDIYSYADILVSRSSDGGMTWSEPIRVNDNDEPLASGLGTDQFQPGVAVDKRGSVGICFYDRRQDRNNFLIGRNCSISKDAGDTWHNNRMNEHNWAPVPGQDQLLNPVYMGDYDSVASDYTQMSSGFIGAAGDNSAGNPDVRIDIFEMED